MGSVTKSLYSKKEEGSFGKLLRNGLGFLREGIVNDEGVCYERNHHIGQKPKKPLLCSVKYLNTNNLNLRLPFKQNLFMD